jgi:hypothetical protein
MLCCPINLISLRKRLELLYRLATVIEVCGSSMSGEMYQVYP